MQRPRRGLHGGGRRELGLQATAAPAGMLWPCLGLLRGKPGAVRRRGCGPTSMRLSASSYPPTLPLLAQPQRSVHACRRAPQPRAHAPPSLAPLQPDFPAARRRQFTGHHRSPLSLSFRPRLSRSSPLSLQDVGRSRIRRRPLAATAGNKLPCTRGL